MDAFIIITILLFVFFPPLGAALVGGIILMRVLSFIVLLFIGDKA